MSNRRWLGLIPFDRPAIQHQTLHEVARTTFDDARAMVLERAELAVTDHNGRRLNERKWREHMNFIGSL